MKLKQFMNNNTYMQTSTGNYQEMLASQKATIVSETLLILRHKAATLACICNTSRSNNVRFLNKVLKVQMYSGKRQTDRHAQLISLEKDFLLALNTANSGLK